MNLSVYKGILIKKEDKWFVLTKSSTVDVKGWPMFITRQTKDTELEVFPTDNHPLEWLETHLNQEVDYNLGKKFLAKETLWHAEITEINKEETWLDIIERYGEASGVPEVELDLWNWLRDNYNPPKRK